MRKLCEVAMILGAFAGAAPIAEAQTLPVTITVTSINPSCTDDNGDPCGTWGYPLEFYDAYATTQAVCYDSSTPPQETNPSVSAYVYNPGGCDGGVGTSMGSVSNYNGSGIDAVYASVSVFVYIIYVRSTYEEDCEYNVIVDNPVNYIFT